MQRGRQGYLQDRECGPAQSVRTYKNVCGESSGGSIDWLVAGLDRTDALIIGGIEERVLGHLRWTLGPWYRRRREARGERRGRGGTVSEGIVGGKIETELRVAVV